jgi:hypothetical protein
MANVLFPSFFYEGQLIIPSEGLLGEVWLSGYYFASNSSKL